MIAILDDEEPVRVALGRLFRSADFHTQVFSSGQDFLASLKSEVPDCLVLDLHLPGLTGLDILHQITALKVNLPVVMITGHDMPGMKERALASGAVAYLLKPLDDTTLIDAVNSCTQPRADC